ncbi:MAG: outer membrane protein assembly factor BamA [Epsilonproteobacteria bacterium]|nr:outer membrane protein assembly factor BamA [Campylobacterota bacterium]
MIKTPKRSIITRTLLFSILFSTIFLQADTIKAVKFKGLIHISDAIAQEIIEVKSGDELNPEKIDKSIKKLYAQQYFEDIWVEEKNGVLTYHVKEKPVIAKVDLSGFSKDKNEETLQAAGIKKGDIYDETRLKTVKQNITKDLESQGYFDSVVEIENEELNPGSLQTNIVVNKGENIYIHEINFYGAKDFGYKDFKPYLANKQKQSMGWFFGRDDGKLKADQLKLDAMRIKEFYLKNGYLDAKVQDPVLRTHFDDYSASLSYKIKEGKQYKVGDLSVVIDEDIADAATLKEEFKLQSGDVFDVEKLRKDISKIRDKVSDKGYAFSNVVPDVKQDRENGIANITYIVKPNDKVYVNNITISGNTNTVDRVIRRELYLSEGEAFSQKDLKDSTNALKRTGFFDNVQIAPKQIDKDTMDLIVNVEEASTGSIMGGISYGSYDGFGINAGISDRNFLGSGIEVGTDIDTSEKTLRGSVHFFNPRVFDSLYSLGGNIYKKDYDYYDYDEESIGGSLKLGRKLSRHLHVSLTYLYEDVELTDVNETLQRSNIYYQEGRTVKSALAPSITYDNTDDYYLPRSGVNITAGFEYAGIGGEAEFLRSTLSAKYYYGLDDLIDYDLIFRVKGKVSTVNDRGNLPLNEKLYLGGMGTVRGFKSGTLAPRNEAGALTGAKKLAAASLELSIPLIESVQMRLLTFYDYGMTGEDKFDATHRSSTGFGIEWAKSPLGVPLQLFYARALDDEEGDRTSNIEFNLGRRF